MHARSHPGDIIRHDCIIPLGLSVTTAAKGLGISRQTLSDILNGRAGLSAEMAIRLEKAGWSNAETWMRIQAQYDLSKARQNEANLVVRHFTADISPS